MLNGFNESCVGREEGSERAPKPRKEVAAAKVKWSGRVGIRRNCEQVGGVVLGPRAIAANLN